MAMRPLFAFVALSIVTACSTAPNSNGPYCNVEDRSTICALGAVEITCFNFATPRVDEPCSHVLSVDESDHSVTGYTEAIYCCGTDAADAGDN